MYGSFDVSTSGLVAQRTRMTVIANNQANRSTLFDADGNYAPYRRQYVELAAGTSDRPDGLGVQVAAIAEDDAPLFKRFEPNSPFADGDGYVEYPNVNSVIESMDAMEAQRAYDANIAVIEATKAMMNAALQVLA